MLIKSEFSVIIGVILSYVIAFALITKLSVSFFLYLVYFVRLSFYYDNPIFYILVIPNEFLDLYFFTVNLSIHY